MRIWKYPLEVTDRQALAMPPDARLLTVQVQCGKCWLWALVDETRRNFEFENRCIAIYGTGNPMPDDPGRYISTFQAMGGDLVFHAFELP